MSKADLHVHTKYSRHPSEWILKRIGTAESYTEPEDLYRILLDRGMDFVTVTDHNQIDGALELRDRYPDRVIVGVEATAYFPEDGCKVHVLVYGLTPEQFARVDVLRNNIYELRNYLRSENLAHSVAHATFAVDGRLTEDHLEKLIVLFNTFESINGARNPLLNRAWTSLLESLTEEDIRTLSTKHGIEPWGDDPWFKGFTGGSDDHAGIFPGRTYTSTPGKTAGEFLEALKQRRSRAEGRHNDFQSLAFSIYKIAWDFSKLRGRRETRDLFSEINRFLFERKKAGWWDRILLERFQTKKGDRIGKLLTGLIQAVHAVNLENPEDLERKLKIVYRDVTLIADELLRVTVKSFVKNLSEASLLKLYQSVSIALPGIVLNLPFLTAFRHLFSNRQMVPEIRKRLGKKYPGRRKKILWFTDTLTDLNGVSVTLTKIGWLAMEKGYSLRLATCLREDEISHRLPPNIMNIPSVFDFQLPFYEKLRVQVPSVLSALEAIYEFAPDEVWISSPGPVGLLGLLAARLMSVPAVGVYHTDFTLEAQEISRDSSIVQLVETGMKWFYSQCDRISVPTRRYISLLEKRGYDRSRMDVFQRGIDIREFCPRGPADHRATKDRYGIPDGRTMLYTGRVSDDKGLDFLLDVYRKVRDQHPDTNLVIAGDGPALDTLRKKASGLDRVIFSGRIDHDKLPALYSFSDLFVFPSVTDTFGMSVLEAQACGLPAVVSDRGGPQEIIWPQETGFVAQAFNRTDWVTKIADLFALMKTEPRRYESMRFEARKRATLCHDWDSVLKTIFLERPVAGIASDRPAEPAEALILDPENSRSDRTVLTETFG